MSNDALQTFLENICRSFSRTLLAMNTHNGQPLTEARLDAVLGAVFNESSRAATHIERQLPDPGSGSSSSWIEEVEEEEQTAVGQREYNNSAKKTLSVATPFKNADVPLSFPKVPSTGEFPNGDVHYCVTLSKDEVLKQGNLGRAVGWATLVYGRNLLVNGGISYFKTCLGVYMCPISECQYTERPRVPRAKRSKDASPLPAKSICETHHEPLIHIACSAKIKMVQHDSKIDVHHQGWHLHPRPHPIRPDIESQRIFANIVQIAPESILKLCRLGPQLVWESVSCTHPLQTWDV